MKIYLEMEGINPRTGQQDTAYVDGIIDDKLIDCVTDPLKFATLQLAPFVEELLRATGKIA